ncbi:hypothetical protein [Flavobacterium sp. 25HG05S-40]|uniref:hypothetical protein n=1 Tax=Flavobacterium sp. 25HG05S-40 TaxID=3458682 RepID=UPI004043F546
MKRKGTNGSSEFGLKQEEIAMILRIPRIQWTHSKTSGRLLPHGIGERVSQMLMYMLSPKAKKLQSLTRPECADTKTKPIVEKRLKENEYQLMKITRKIAPVQEKLEKCSKAVELMHFLNSPEEIKKAADPETISSLEKTYITKYTDCKSQLTLLELDQELLENERLVLEAALQKLP